MTSGWSIRASWGRRTSWWRNPGMCEERGLYSLFPFLVVYDPLIAVCPSGGGTWGCRVWTCLPRLPSCPPSPVRRLSRSWRTRASTRHPLWMRLGEKKKLKYCMSGSFWSTVFYLVVPCNGFDLDLCECVYVCVQVNPGHGDFRERVGLYPSREDKAVRPGQQSAL